MNEDHLGSDFDDFLREEELLGDAEATAAKRVVEFQENPESGEELVPGSEDELRSEAARLSQHSELMRFLDERFAEEATIPLEQLESEAS